MSCSVKTMLRTAGAIGLVAVIGYLAVPEARAFIVASAPVLIALICPVSMIVMMLMMNSSKSKQAEPGKAAAPEPARLGEGATVRGTQADGDRADGVARGEAQPALPVVAVAREH
ncbi:MAG: DUF2933 domain-containing protein [Rubrivivax sp.]